MKTHLTRQRGSTIFIVLILTLLTGGLTVILFKGHKSENTQVQKQRNHLFAKNGAEAAYEWLIENLSKDPPFNLVTMMSNGTSIENNTCKTINQDSLSPLQGIRPFRDNQWLVRNSVYPNTLSGAQTELIKMSVYSPTPWEMVIRIRVKIDYKDSLEVEYRGHLESFADYAFFGQGDMDVGWRWGKNYGGRIHVNGNLYLSAQESPTGRVDYNAPRISATGGIYRYKNATTDLALQKQAYINSNKTAYFGDPALAALLHANFDFTTKPKGRVFVNNTEMVLRDSTTTDDVDNPSWNTIKKKWHGALQDRAAHIPFDLIPDLKNNPCHGKGYYPRYQKFSEFVNLGYSPIDSIFNSAYGHYTPGNKSYRMGPNGMNTLAKHANYNIQKCNKLKNGVLTNPFYLTDSNDCSATLDHHRWYGGTEGGQWIVTRVIDLSSLNYFPGKEAGTILDAEDYNLIIQNASLLAYPLTIVTRGEVYIMGDYNVGRAHNNPDLMHGGQFIGTVTDPVAARNVDTTKIVGSAVIARGNRIWFLSYDWNKQSYGHAAAGKRGMAPFDQKSPRKRQNNTYHNMGTYVGVFVTGEPKVSEAFWLTGKSHGGAFSMTPNTMEHMTTGTVADAPMNLAFRFLGTLGFLQDGLVDTSGAFGDGRNLFSADFNGYALGRDQSIKTNGKIPPKYARAWHTYAMTFDHMKQDPPGVTKNFRLIGMNMNRYR